MVCHRGDTKCQIWKKEKYCWLLSMSCPNSKAIITTSLWFPAPLYPPVSIPLSAYLDPLYKWNIDTIALQIIYYHPPLTRLQYTAQAAPAYRVLHGLYMEVLLSPHDGTWHSDWAHWPTTTNRVTEKDTFETKQRLKTMKKLFQNMVTSHNLWNTNILFYFLHSG